MCTHITINYIRSTCVRLTKSSSMPLENSTGSALLTPHILHMAHIVDDTLLHVWRHSAQLIAGIAHFHCHAQAPDHVNILLLIILEPNSQKKNCGRVRERACRWRNRSRTAHLLRNSLPGNTCFYSKYNIIILLTPSKIF